MHNATFCGAFPGDGWSGGISSAVFAGCVPVIVMDGIELPFENVLNYEAFLAGAHRRGRHPTAARDPPRHLAAPHRRAPSRARHRTLALRLRLDRPQRAPPDAPARERSSAVPDAARARQRGIGGRVPDDDACVAPPRSHATTSSGKLSQPWGCVLRALALGESVWWTPKKYNFVHPRQSRATRGRLSWHSSALWARCTWH